MLITKAEPDAKILEKIKLSSAYKRLIIGFMSSMMIALAHFISDIIEKGLFASCTLKTVLILAFIHNYFFIKFLPKKSKNILIICTILITELSNAVFLILGLIFYPSCLILYSQISALVYVFYQSFAFAGKKTLIILSIKQTIIWVLCVYKYSGLTFNEHIPMILCTIGIFMFYFLTTFCEQLKDLSLSKSKSKTQKMHKNILGVVEAITDSIIVINKDKEVVFGNTAGKNMIKNDSIETFFSSKIYYRRYSKDKPSDESFFNDILELFSHKLDSETSFGILKSNKELIEWKGKLIIWDNNPSIILCGRDVSHLVKMEKESTENQYKSALLRTVSHELRTPTSAVISISQIISASQELSLENKERLEIIKSSCGYQLCLINDLLDYAQILSKCLKVSKSFFNIHYLLLECLKIVKFQLHEKSVNLELSIKNLPELIFSDPYRLKQILLNLLSNARKFTIQGKILLEALYNDDMMIINCQDTGIGIPKEKIDNLFTPFGKLENSHVINPQGVGLGLVISNMLVQELGGTRISVESEVDNGSKFSFSLPVKDSFINNNLDIAEENVQVNVPSIYTKTILHKFEVLIVDDCYFNILALKQMMESEGIVCDFAVNGKEALEKIRKGAYSCVLMDCEMPIMDGWEACKCLKIMLEKNEIKRIPVIIGCTAHNSEDVVDRCKACGMADVIVKPCNKSTLLSKIRQNVDICDEGKKSEDHK